jgi:acyl-CoA synthetase (AMP-forming)/AMP-acid ligase II
LWINGPSVTSGYFAAPEKTAAAIGVLQSDGARRFMRTGDLGCLRGGFLFVLGRLKDIIIIRGRKYYPQDLEAAATLSNSFLASGGGAAFAIQQERGESLALVHELTRLGWRTSDPEQVRADIREALTYAHGVTPSVVVLIKPGTLPRTTSGKVRRTQCRELLLADGFEQLTVKATEYEEADEEAAGSSAISAEASRRSTAVQERSKEI